MPLSNYFKPKKIYIIGIDFYNKMEKAYYVSEVHDETDSEHMDRSIREFRWGMIRNFSKYRRF